jgi:uncharacterized protein
MKLLQQIAWILVVVGALNLGLIGFFGSSLVGAVFGAGSNIVYALVGLSGLYVLSELPGILRRP